MRDSDKPLLPLAERPAADILKAALDLLWLCRLLHFQARGETFLVCDRGAITKSGRVPVFVERELPLREAGELVADLLRGFPVGHKWRWRLVLCPVQERTRAGIHVLLADPPRKRRDWTEIVWMRSSAADKRGSRGAPRAAAAPDPAARPPLDPRPRTRKTAQAGPAPRATMGA